MFEQINDKVVFFGHQSVGYNIIEGIKDLSAEHQKEYHIKSLEKKDNFQNIDFNNVNLLETTIGRNRYPLEKIEDFAHYFETEISDHVDIALMKFCYVDSGQEISSEELADAYIQEMERLEQTYPHVTFVYVTMPLRGTPRKLDVWAKNIIFKILGRPIYGRDDNIERHEFNQALRTSKAHTGRLFDLAMIESTRSDGNIQSFRKNGRDYPVLVPEYTYDGGHLNKRGRVHVAGDFLSFIRKVSADK